MTILSIKTSRAICIPGLGPNNMFTDQEGHLKEYDKVELLQSCEEGVSLKLGAKFFLVPWSNVEWIETAQDVNFKKKGR